jgi:hypothetical protein
LGNFSPSVSLTVFMDFRHDGIPMRILGQRSGTSTQPITRIRHGGNDPNLNLDLLTFGYTEVFVELDSLAMNDAVNRSNHLEISCLWPTRLYLILWPAFQVPSRTISRWISANRGDWTPIEIFAQAISAWEPHLCNLMAAT